MTPSSLSERFCDLDIQSEGLEYFIGTEVPSGPAPLCRVKQTHGKEILHVRRELVETLSGPGYLRYCYDGMVSAEAGAFLTVYSADCLPLLLFDPHKRIVGAVHAGWRGTLLGIAELAVESMKREFSSDPGQIRVMAGPSIRSCCFEIREDVSALFLDNDPLWEGCIVSTGGKMRLDLHRINRYQLVRAGVLEGHLSLDAPCTHCHSDRLPSFRREGNAGRRILSGIRLVDGG